MGIKIIACVCKWITKIVSKEMLQAHVNIFHCKNTVPHVTPVSTSQGGSMSGPFLKFSDAEEG